MKHMLNVVRRGSSFALVALALATLWPDAAGIRPGRDDRYHHRRRHRRAAAARRGRERDCHPRAVGHDLRDDDPRGWPLLDSRHARRRSVHRDRRVHRQTGTALRAADAGGHQVNLGVATDVDVQRARDRGAGDRHGLGAVDPVFSSSRTGAATAVEPRGDRDAADDHRPHRRHHAPDAAGQRQLVRRPGQSPEQHHGRRVVLQQLVRPRRQPGERTDVAPISLESIEQVQVSIAPFDVRQGNFIGAAVNTVTRSGTNQLHGVVLPPVPQRGLRRHRGARPDGQSRHIQVPQHRRLGGGPIVKNKLFVVRQLRERGGQRGRSRRSAPTRAASRSAGTVTRVLASDLDSAERVPVSRTSSTHGRRIDSLADPTPAKRYLLRTDYNLNTSNKISFRYNQLDSSSDNNLSGSTSAGLGRSTVQHELPELRRARTTRFSRTSSRASASGTR